MDRQAAANRVFKFIVGVLSDTCPPSHSASCASHIQLFRPTVAETPSFCVACDALKDAIEAGLVRQQQIHLLVDLLQKGGSKQHPDVVISANLSALLMSNANSTITADQAEVPVEVQLKLEEAKQGQGGDCSSKASFPLDCCKPEGTQVDYSLEPMEINQICCKLNKKQLAAMAHDTLSCCDTGKYRNMEGIEVVLPISHAVETTRLHPAGAALPKISVAASATCTVNIMLGSTLAAAQHLANQGLRACVLNFASAKNPGGGFRGGANAQEESLARASGLYPCLMKPQVSAYYRENEADKSCIYTDNIIVSPAVPIFRDDDGCKLGAPYIVGIITCPAPNFGVAASRAKTEAGVDRIKAVRRQRMARLLTLCADETFDAIVLGAWGCGVFRNDVTEVAQEFQELLQGEFRFVFPRVVFAILDEPSHSIFVDVFNCRLGPHENRLATQNCTGGGLAQSRGQQRYETRERTGRRKGNAGEGRGNLKADRKSARWGKYNVECD